ncbi:MAG TPA: hypothetical protein VL728_10430 [Cyclobacteriaceae bacterium]|jgi:hypothetical protein|nr:hypothetical protein [Cyclobacteriaceae bacterium]
MKKLTYKDLIMVLGVLVAGAIIVTSVYFSDAKKDSVKVPGKKVKPAAILNTVVSKFTSRATF